MKIEDEILVNQLAQKIIDIAQGLVWFSQHDVEGKRGILRAINTFVKQASMRSEDAALAIADSGLKPTLTPCVLLARADTPSRLAQMASLPETELGAAFRLLISLLGVADSRRRTTKPLNLTNHWWHRDLSNAGEVRDIIRQRNLGKL